MSRPCAKPPLAGARQLPMRPDTSVKLPDHEEVERALIEILRARGNRALRAYDAYRLLADHFKSDWKQLHEKSAIRDELKWHNVCRTARSRLVKTGRMKRLPFNSWSLTEATFPGDLTQSNAGAEELACPRN
jgi:hypothetical protein